MRHSQVGFSTVTSSASVRRKALCVGVVATALLTGCIGIADAVPASAHTVGDRSTGCSSASAPQVVSARPATDYDTAFDTYGKTSGAWSGADSTYSTSLPGNRELWAFSDTFVGPVNTDGSRPTTTPFVNNSFVVTSHGNFRTVVGGTADAPTANAAPSDPNAWYWSGDPITSGRRLEVPYLQFHKTGTGVFDFAWQQNVLGIFDARTLHLQSVVDLPSATGVEWGSYVLPAGPYTYVYGVEDLGSVKYLHLARVRGTDLRAPWQYYTGTNWSSDEASSARLMDGISNEFSVSRMGRGYVLITQDTTELLSPHVVAYFSCTPTGPFTGKTAVYTTPETGANGTYHDANVYTYNPHAHPELSRGDQLLITYNVNSFDTNDVYDNASIYRPRFIVATFRGPGVPSHGGIVPVDR